jgi:hypothetical protein
MPCRRSSPCALVLLSVKLVVEHRLLRAAVLRALCRTVNPLWDLAELNGITADPRATLCSMSATHPASNEAAWRRVSDRLAPLAAAATAAGSASSSISTAQLEDIMQCTTDVEGTLRRRVGLEPAVFTCSVPQLLF